MSEDTAPSSVAQAADDLVSRISQLEKERDKWESKSTIFREQRNEILKALLELMLTRRKGVPVEEVEKAFNAARDVIYKYKSVVDETPDESERNPADITLGELVQEVLDQEVGMICINGFDKEEEPERLAWVVVAATDDSAEALMRWTQIEYDDEPMPQMAKAAYMAYGAETGHKNFKGDPMPEWEALPKNIREAWQAAAHEVVQLCMGVRHESEEGEGSADESVERVGGESGEDAAGSEG